MPKNWDAVVEAIRRLRKPARNADDMVDAAGGVDDLLRNAPPPRSSVDLPLPERAPSFEGLDAVSPSPVDLSLDSPNWGPLSRSADRFNQLRRGQSANLRNQPFNAVAGQAIRDADAARAARIASDAYRADTAKTIGGAVGAVGAAAGVGALSDAAKVSPPPASAEGVTSTEGTADLANESRPAPTVMPEQEQAFTDKFKRQYTAREKKRESKGAGTYPKPQTDPRAQAQALIKQLNQMRMDAGGEVPEAKQMMSQINSLLAQADQARNSRTYPQAQADAAQNPSDYHAQAQALIAKLNDMRRQAGGEVPQAQAFMAEVRRLQALGDQQRNAQTTARR